MTLFAVAMRDYSVAFIEFYWADDEEHAMEQAINANPSSRHICVAIVPDRKDMVHISTVKEAEDVSS